VDFDRLSADNLESARSGTFDQEHELRRYFSILGLPVEMRIPVGKGRTISGYYDDLERLVQKCKFFSGRSASKPYPKIETIYTTLNQIKPELLARSYNNVNDWAKHTTADADIIMRRWLPVDVDAVRPAGISATEIEKTAAIACARSIREYLADAGFPLGLLSDSGNGGHALWRVDLPNTDEVRDAFRRLLDHLAKRFNAAAVKVDTSVFNASRIWKVYGTKVCKGDEVGDRVHRMARILELPESVQVVPLGLILKVLGTETNPCTSLPMADIMAEARRFEDEDQRLKDKQVVRGNVIGVPEWCKAHGLEIKKADSYRGGARYVLVACPFTELHSSGDPSGAVIFQKPEGRVSFKCQHTACKEKRWPDLLRHYGEKVDDAEPERERPADTLVRLATGRSELWHAEDGSAFASIARAGHTENYSLQSDAFRNWLRSEFLDVAGRGPSKNALDEAMGTLEAIAVSKGATYQTYLRIARLSDRIVIDLGDDTWKAVEIRSDGWKVCQPSVKFIRTSNMARLPMPVQGGTIDLLRPFINVSDESFPLVVGTILDALKGHGPYLVSIFTGEQGAAKSTTTKIIRRLIDPVQKSELASCPKDERDLGCEGVNNYVMAFDNLSKLPGWLSDAFCRIATGGGIKTRKLYKDAEQQIFDVCRPLLLNGIEDFATAGDLLSRSVQITVEPISPEARREESEFWSEFTHIMPGILGALYDALAHGLAHLKDVKLETLPRMADSAKWIAACAPAIGWDYTNWHTPFQESQDAGVESVLDLSLPGKLLVSWFETYQGNDWLGLPSELYHLLHEMVPEDKAKFFPSNPQSLSNTLRRVGPSLRARGINVGTTKKQKIDGQSRRLVRISRVPKAENSSATDGQPVGNPAAPCPETVTTAASAVAEDDPVAEGCRSSTVLWQPDNPLPPQQLQPGCRRLPKICLFSRNEEEEGNGDVEATIEQFGDFFGNLRQSGQTRPQSVAVTWLPGILGVVSYHFPHTGETRVKFAIENSVYEAMHSEHRSRLRLAYPGQYIVDVPESELLAG
jgi:hypothetical protein